LAKGTQRRWCGPCFRYRWRRRQLSLQLRSLIWNRERTMPKWLYFAWLSH